MVWLINNGSAEAGQRLRRFGLWLALFLWSAFPAAATMVTDLVAEKVEQEYGVELPEESHVVVHFAQKFGQEGQFIREFWMDKSSGQFIANVVSNLGEVERVWGMAVLSSYVPVPIRRMMPNEIVQLADLQMVELPIFRLSDFAIRRQDDLVGKEVRRALAPGRPVQTHSVAPPRVIERGQKVKMVLNNGALRLTASGRAMDDAYVGQEIDVVNLSSRKTVAAVAVSDGVVVVQQ